MKTNLHDFADCKRLRVLCFVPCPSERFANPLPVPVELGSPPWLEGSLKINTTEFSVKFSRRYVSMVHALAVAVRFGRFLPPLGPKTRSADSDLGTNQNPDKTVPTAPNLSPKFVDIVVAVSCNQ